MILLELLNYYVTSFHVLTSSNFLSYYPCIYFHSTYIRNIYQYSTYISVKEIVIGREKIVNKYSPDSSTRSNL